MIKIINAFKCYKNGDENIYALNNVSLLIESGELVAITGKSGGGKSTLLNTIGLLCSCNDGEYYFNGVAVNTFSEKQKAKIRNQEIGFIFQNYNLENSFSVFENIEIPLLIDGYKKSVIKKRVLSVLDSLGLKSRYKSKVKKLSGGEKQRVAIARALVNNPNIILADEATGALDTKNSENIMNILLSLNANGKTVIFVTHDQELALMAKRIITISDGVILSDVKNV